MNALLKSATVVDTKSDFHNDTVDILIVDGIISKISKRISNPNNYLEIRLDNLHISPGWFDSSVCFGEPGFEERETIAHGLKVAGLSGFTSVGLNPNTNPVLDNSSTIRFVLEKANNSAVTLLPFGALTTKSEGVDLAELYDMHAAGAVAFSDYQKAISNPNLLKIALQYVESFDGLVCSFPMETQISGAGVMNEHVNSTRLGLKGIPSLSEELQIARDLILLEYTNGKLHIPSISTSESVSLIRKAKEKKLDVTCSTTIHNLVLTDAMLEDFDTNYKVLPPLRTSADCEALIEGLKDGTIDMVTSDHNPIDIEHKNVEFDNAMFGTVGLESAFSVLNSIFSTRKTISLLTSGKERFGLNKSIIAVGTKADLSLFNPTGSSTFTKNDILSKSKNSCFLGYKTKGSVYGVISNNKIELIHE